MRVVGFTFIKNAVKMQYPVIEALQSILPLCDEVVVAVGKSEDNTREMVAGISPKIKIVDTIWDEQLREGGRVLAAETNKAFQAIDAAADWCIYIQGDEVMHEQDYPAIQQAMLQYKDDSNVEGLLFKYHHFFGSYKYIGIESKWYRHEIRIVKNNKKIYSYRDAQGFKINDGQKLKVKPVDAFIYHYGWVQNPETMKYRKDYKDTIYNPNATPFEDALQNVTETYVKKQVKALIPFTGTHPAVMQRRIANTGWDFYWNEKNNRLKFKDKFKNLVALITGGKRPFDYQNYKIV